MSFLKKVDQKLLLCFWAVYVKYQVWPISQF